MLKGGRKTDAMREARARAMASLEKPEPYLDMPESHKVVWRAVVENEDAIVFATEATRIMLREYCSHVVTVTELSRMIDEFESAKRGAKSVMLQDYLKMVNMRQRESTMATSKATKLRLTNQSRYQHTQANSLTTKSVVDNKAGSTAKPWET